MISIHLDDATAKGLELLAAAAGMTLQQYLESLASQNTGTALPQLSDAEFDTQLSGLTHHGPSLPPDFSRADIYSDHD